MPVKAIMTDLLSRHFPQYKFAQGKDAEVKKVINNSKVRQRDAVVPMYHRLCKRFITHSLVASLLQISSYHIQISADIANCSMIIDTLTQVQKELGLQIHPWQESIIDMATTLIQQGIAQPVSA